MGCAPRLCEILAAEGGLGRAPWCRSFGCPASRAVYDSTLHDWTKTLLLPIGPREAETRELESTLERGRRRRSPVPQIRPATQPVCRSSPKRGARSHKIRAYGPSSPSLMLPAYQCKLAQARVSRIFFRNLGGLNFQRNIAKFGLFSWTAVTSEIFVFRSRRRTDG